MFRKRGNTTIILISHWQNENSRHVLSGQAIRENWMRFNLGECHYPDAQDCQKCPQNASVSGTSVEALK